MGKDIAKRFLISGRVQGVFYRAFTVDAAYDLGLKGTVKNLPDGRVEIFVQGSTENIAQLKAQLEEGPPAAIVTSVDEFDEKIRRELTSFTIQY